jgi:hypothetical protein
MANLDLVAIWWELRTKFSGWLAYECLSNIEKESLKKDLHKTQRLYTYQRAGPHSTR